MRDCARVLFKHDNRVVVLQGLAWEYKVTVITQSLPLFSFLSLPVLSKQTLVLVDEEGGVRGSGGCTAGGGVTVRGMGVE